jgi:hypothetical protein
LNQFPQRDLPFIFTGSHHGYTDFLILPKIRKESFGYSFLFFHPEKGGISILGIDSKNNLVNVLLIDQAETVGLAKETFQKRFRLITCILAYM